MEEIVQAVLLRGDCALGDRPQRVVIQIFNHPGDPPLHDQIKKCRRHRNGARPRIFGDDHGRRHTFRATGITAYLKNGGQLEAAAAMANHASTRITQLDDRRAEQLSLDEIERVRI